MFKETEMTFTFTARPVSYTSSTLKIEASSIEEIFTSPYFYLYTDKGMRVECSDGQVLAFKKWQDSEQSSGLLIGTIEENA